MSKCKAGEIMTITEVKYLITGVYYHAYTINYAITSHPPVDLHGHHIISEITNLCMNFIISSSFLP